jgi:hypothetical protein
VKCLFFVVLLAGVAGAESVRTIQGSSPTGSFKTQIVRNVNGREVPVSLTEEAVVSDSGGVRIIERTVREFDPSGKPGPPSKIRIETRKEPGGVEKSLTTVRRADLNGNFQLAERRTQIVRKSGDNSDVLVTVERTTLNQGLDVVEKTEQQERATAAGRTSATSTTYQLGPNGRMTEVARRTAERTVSGDKSIENAAEYESASTGQMRLARQTVTRAEPGRTEVDLFELQAPGQAAAPDSVPQLTKRQVIERSASPKGVTETISVQFPLANDRSRLSELRKVEEVVCQGDCGQK